MVTFERENWKEFRTLDGLCRMAGVSRNRIAAVVAKELVDNALDESSKVEVGLIENANGFFVQDAGRGIDPGIVAELFSIKRPQRSTKFLRLPTRGALGNGLRVVAGAVLVTKGQLIVRTRGQSIRLTPQDDGSTAMEVISNYDGEGTRVEVILGDDVKVNEYSLNDAKWAILLQDGTNYPGKTNAYWYTSRDLFELFNAATGEDTTVRKLLEEFEGGDKSSVSDGFKGKKASDITLQEAEILLKRLQSVSKPVKPSRLGKCEFISRGFYAKYEGTFKSEATGEVATIPYIVEASARILTEDFENSIFQMFVNKTPITGDISAHHSKKDKDLRLSGCNISDRGYVTAIPIGKKSMKIFVSIISPYIPKTTEGKSPDLAPFKYAIVITVEKAAKKAIKANPERASVKSQKEIVLENLDDAIETVSGNHRYRYAQRQLYYHLRPIVKEKGAGELQYPNFEGIITDYQKEVLGHDIPGMYKDPRGSIYHPHIQERIPLGGLMVECYKPPNWTFNKILFIEKEGFFQNLIDEHWPEKYDCALISSKGQGTDAAKDLLDSLEGVKEDVTVYAIHDADAAGTMIYQSMQDETKSRGARKVNIINLGLEPWEALEMELEPENVTYKKKQPVARYVFEEESEPPEGEDGETYNDWSEWLQKHRVELNAMTVPEFLDWISSKFEDMNKLVPPSAVMAETLRESIRVNIVKKETARILKEAKLDQQIEDKLKALQPEIDNAISTLPNDVVDGLSDDPIQSWRNIVDSIGEDICECKV